MIEWARSEGRASPQKQMCMQSTDPPCTQKRNWLEQFTFSRFQWRGLLNWDTAEFWQFPHGRDNRYNMYIMYNLGTRIKSTTFGSIAERFAWYFHYSKARIATIANSKWSDRFIRIQGLGIRRTGMTPGARFVGLGNTSIFEYQKPNIFEMLWKKRHSTLSDFVV